MKRLRNLGPGLLVTAAFIGPGTVTTASIAGASFGFALLWTLVFAVLATIVLQEMAARLGLASRQGLGEAVRSTFSQPLIRLVTCGFILVAIAFGNAAYQAGNLSGASIGLSTLFPASRIWVLIISGLTFVLLISGKYKLIERVLIALVVLMSLVFLLTALMTRPPIGEMTRGMFQPTIPDGSLAMILGLIGTTVVPYNLFLHSSSVQEKWSTEVPVEEALGESRRDTVLAITLGGLVTLAILTTAAATFYGKGGLKNAADMARQLEDVLGGPAAQITFALGLFSAGLTSSITAPLAAAYATCGVMGWKPDLNSWRFRGVWILVLGLGTLAAFLGGSPADTILIAQVANGLLLPFIAIFLLIVVNRKILMGERKNGIISNLLGFIVVLIATGLGTWKIYQELRLVPAIH